MRPKRISTQTSPAKKENVLRIAYFVIILKVMSEELVVVNKSLRIFFELSVVL